MQGQQQAALEASQGTGRWSSLISVHIKTCLFPNKKLLLLTASSTGSQRRERQVACFLLPPSVITRIARSGLPWQWAWHSVPWLARPVSGATMASVLNTSFCWGREADPQRADLLSKKVLFLHSNFSDCKTAHTERDHTTQADFHHFIRWKLRRRGSRESPCSAGPPREPRKRRWSEARCVAGVCYSCEVVGSQKAERDLGSLPQRCTECGDGRCDRESRARACT